MRKKLQKYWGLFNINLQRSMVYRFSFFSSFLADVVKVCVMLAIWVAVFKQRSTIAGFDYPMMITYLLISQGLNNIYGFQNAAERLITGKIVNGTIGFDLLKPVKFTNARLAENFGQTVLRVVFVILMLLGFKLFMPELSAPFSVTYAILFVISSFTGFFIMFSVSLMSGLLAFWLMNSWGVRNAKDAIINFCSGALVPIAMLPEWLQSIVNVLPFKNIIYVPTMIYMGQYSIETALMNIALQIFWAVALWFLLQGLFALAIRKVTINGG